MREPSGENRASLAEPRSVKRRFAGDAPSIGDCQSAPERWKTIASERGEITGLSPSPSETGVPPAIRIACSMLLP